MKNKLSLVRKDNLAVDGVEGLWFELFLSKLHGVLIGMFYRPPNSSCYFDKELSLELAAAEGKEVILLDFLPSKSGSGECKQCITDATCSAQHSVFLIDLIATNTPKNVYSSGLLVQV